MGWFIQYLEGEAGFIVVEKVELMLLLSYNVQVHYKYHITYLHVAYSKQLHVFVNNNK